MRGRRKALRWTGRRVVRSAWKAARRIEWRVYMVKKGALSLKEELRAGNWGTAIVFKMV